MTITETDNFVEYVIAKLLLHDPAEMTEPSLSRRLPRGRLLNYETYLMSMGISIFSVLMSDMRTGPICYPGQATKRCIVHCPYAVQMPKQRIFQPEILPQTSRPSMRGCYLFYLAQRNTRDHHKRSLIDDRDIVVWSVTKAPVTEVSCDRVISLAYQPLYVRSDYIKKCSRSSLRRWVPVSV